jgi:hypothetical protein
LVPYLTETEVQQFTALRAWLIGLVPSTTDVIRAEINRVPEPQGADFIVMTPLRIERLGTNFYTTNDAIVTASIAGSIMNVTVLARGTVQPGAPLTDGTVGVIAANTGVITQLSGSVVGGTGAYAVTGSQVLASGTLYAGTRNDETQTKWTVQLDIHGPNSAGTAQTIVGLFRTEIAVDDLGESGYAIAPLWCDDAQQRPFINAEQQFEYRWGMDLVLQVNPIVRTGQQFADQVIIDLVEADALLE